MKHGSLFSGIGGFDLAAEWMGWENVFHCEWNPFGQKVLKYYWPNAESFSDITKTDFSKYANTIDIVSGGFPCQPYSAAGRRRGKEDERHLWPHMLRAIKEISPRYVVGENVRGLTNWNGGMVFEEVCAEMENIGYSVAPVLIPACAVNAPHRRDRIFFIAYANVNGFAKQWEYDRSSKNDERGNTSFKWSANSKDVDACNTSTNFIEGQNIVGGIGSKENGEKEQFANTTRIFDLDKGNDKSKGNIGEIRSNRNESSALVQKGQKGVQLSKHRGMEQDKNYFSSSNMVGQENDGNQINRMDGDAANAIGNGRGKGIECEYDRIQEREICSNKSKDGDEIWGKFRDGSNDRDATNTNNNRFTKKTDWSNFPIESPVCFGNDGVPHKLDGITFSKWRKESIKAGGNAVVPPLIFEIFKTIQIFDNINKQQNT